MELHDKILRAAAKVYAESGYRGATTRRIAQEAGVNEITLFRHFGSKDALLLEALQSCRQLEEFPPLPENPADPEGELTTWATAHHQAVFARRHLLRTCMGEMSERPDLGGAATKGPFEVAAMLRTYFVRLRELGHATRPFNPDAVSWLLLAAIFADAMWRDVMDTQAHIPSAAESLHDYIRILLGSIGAEVSAGPTSWPMAPRAGAVHPGASSPDAA